MIFQRQVGYALLQHARFAARFLHVTGGRGTGGVPGQATFVGFMNSLDQMQYKLCAIPSLRHSAATLLPPASLPI